jgi:hypothetical protein
MADDKKLDYITTRLDKVADDVVDINTKLEVHIAKFDSVVEDVKVDRTHLQRNTDILNTNTTSLQEHMKRTDILEQYVRNIEGRFTPVELDVMRKKAVSEWIKAQLVLVAKIGGAITALGGIAAAAKMLLAYLG